MKNRISRVISVLMLATISIGAASQPGIASASAQTVTLNQVTAQPAVPIDPQELEAYLDGLLAAEMAENHIPGAVVAVVEDGRVLLAKGYGYADLEGRMPVDPERTLFRLGSVSKLLVWTAVMQLLEQGQLSLDTDVNTYLDFTIPATFSKPITLRHLLTHTPGFEERLMNTTILEAEQMIPLASWMPANLPARVFPPGEVTAYSNYGAALAGYIVERVSGLPFSEYVAQNIFAPLGMERSTFRQPLPETLAGDMATGYNFTSGQYVAGTFEYQLSYPAGGASATATDMARFLLAHLQNGELDGQSSILQEQTARMMHTPLYTTDSRLNSGIAYGFFANTVNGRQMLSHGGDMFLFHSGLYLIPEENLGVFISTNGSGGWTVDDEVIKRFLDRYYPAVQLPTPQSGLGFAERIAPYLGEYTPARSNFTSFEKMSALMGTGRINTSLGSNGVLVLTTGGRIFRFAEVEPGLMQDLGEPTNKLVYRTGPDGRLFLTVATMQGSFDMFRTPWYGTANLHRLLFLGTTLLFLGALLAWLTGFFVGRRRRLSTSQPASRQVRLARWAAALFGLLWLVLLFGFASMFADILPAFGVPRVYVETVPILNVMLALAYVLGGLALVIPVFAVLAWVRHHWNLGGRIFYSLLALLALLQIWSLVYWDMLL